MSSIANFDLFPTDELFDALFKIPTNNNSSATAISSLENSQFLIFNVNFE